MSKSPFTFFYYINTCKSDRNVAQFWECFGDKVNDIPEDVVSSIKIMNVLNISSRDQRKFRIFHNAYMGYFAEKIQKDFVC
jgi:hypothetical protein